MRKVFLALEVLLVLAVYAFACGALNVPLGGAGYQASFLSALSAPFQALTPLAGAVLAAGVTWLLLAPSLIPGGSGGANDGRSQRPLSSAFNAAFLATVVVVVASVALVITAFATGYNAGAIGLLYTSAVLEAGLGALLAALLFVFRRQGRLFLPALVALFAGVTALGAMFWIGQGVGFRM